MRQDVLTTDTLEQGRVKLNSNFTQLYGVNIEDYGGTGDQQVNEEASIDTGTAALTTVAAVFTTADVGKSIRVYGAGAAGADLLTTILAYVGPSAVTLATNAGTTIAAKRIKWGTDNTTPLQDAIQDVWDGVFAEVFLPLGIYGIFGPLITSLDAQNPNCQIYVPLRQPGAQTCTVKLKGEGAPDGFGGILVDSEPSLRGVILESHIIGTGTDPCVIGTTYFDDGFGGGGFNYTKIETENIHIRVKSVTGTTNVAPTMTAFNFARYAKMRVISCQATTESSPWDSAQPASNACGFVTPIQSNGAETFIERCTAKNFYKNFVFNEHTNADELRADSGFYNFYCDALNGLGHAIFAKRLYSNGGKHALVLGTTSTKLIVEQLAHERYPGAFATKWYDGVSDIFAVNASSVLYGSVTMSITESGGDTLVPTISTNIIRGAFIDMHVPHQLSLFGKKAVTTSAEAGSGAVGGNTTTDAAIFEINRNRTASTDLYYGSVDIYHGGQSGTDNQIGFVKFFNLGSSDADKRLAQFNCKTNGSAQKGILNLAVHSGTALANRIQFSSDWIKLLVPHVIDADISPAQITADQNNYSPTSAAAAATFRLSSDAARALTGIAASQVDGRELTIFNVGANDITGTAESASSTAANRFATAWTLTAGQALRLIYDGTSSRWRKIV